MKSLAYITFGLFAIFSQTKAQNVNIICNFSIVGSNYTCTLADITIADNENANFVIGGEHLPGQNNAGVERVFILSSSTPFVISQFFITFPVKKV